MKKIFALLLALTLVLTFASCANKTSDTDNLTTETESTTENVTEALTEVSESETQAEVSEETSDENTTVSSEDSSEKESEKEETSETEAEKVKVPSTNEEILKAYNDAVNNAYSKKAGFTKERYTDNENMDMSVALKAFRSLVEKFVGIGEENKYSETVTKGKWDSDPKREYLRKSTLTSSDITGASVKEEGDFYTVTLNIKNGSSSGNKNSKTSTSSLDKCGICVGNEDKNYYDHKSGPVIYDAIAGTYEGAKIEESYRNAKAVAKINAKTGELVNLTVTFDISVAIDINIGSGTATGTTHVIYKDFKY